MARSRPAVAAAFAAGVLAGRLAGSQPLGLARMGGWSIAAPDAAGWITDFLNAAYYRRPPDERTLDDLRLAFAIVTTRWHRMGGRRLRAGDVVAFHRAFGRERLRARGRLARESLLRGAEQLLGGWFPEAYADDRRRGWGIAFETLQAKAAFDPGLRLRHARLGALTPGTAPPEQQTWHTYPPVPAPESAFAALTAPERWTDFATAIGRFTAVRAGGLAGQTFEIEVAAGADAGRPVFTRGYVTATKLLTAGGTQPASPAGTSELRAFVDDLNAGLARYGRDEPPAVPEDAEPVLALELTTHEGHFMGAGCNRLVGFRQGGGAFLRAAGTWDPMPWPLAQAYALAGRQAQHAFWGPGDEEASMLRQIA